MTSEETPEQVVASALASAALDGRDVSPEWQAVLLRVADGSLSADEAVRMAVAEAGAHAADARNQSARADYWFGRFEPPSGGSDG